jgi:bla regulator protein blaR1
MIGGVWVCGVIAVLLRWFLRWWRIRAARQDSVTAPLDAPIAVMFSHSLLEPGVFGIFRPVLLLPEGITARLAPDQLRAILVHELAQVRRRDNLSAALHMLTEAIFWFHPLVWWIGARLVEERERACDEDVLQRGSAPEVYAQGILNICKFYRESRLACAAGVTGSDLQRRIETIMQNPMPCGLNFGRKLLLAVAGMAAVAGPLAIGVGSAPHLQAQPPSGARLEFEAASVKTNSARNS